MRNKQNKQNVVERKRFTAWDIVVVAVLLCTSVFIIMTQSRKSDGELMVVVKKNSEIVYSRSLKEISKESELCIDEEYHVILGLSCDGVEVKSSDCGDKVCVNTGKITRAGQSIVCLPAHVSVELKGNNSDVDVVAG